MQKTNTVMVLSGGCFSFWFDVDLVLSAALECTDAGLQLIISTHAEVYHLRWLLSNQVIRSRSVSRASLLHQQCLCPCCFHERWLLGRYPQKCHPHLLCNLHAALKAWLSTDESFKLIKWSRMCHPSLPWWWSSRDMRFNERKVSKWVVVRLLQKRKGARCFESRLRACWASHGIIAQTHHREHYLFTGTGNVHIFACKIY
jgi:hypothetical protein